MLPHQFSSFAEGLFGPLHSEFERTPKAASVTTRSTVDAAGERARTAEAPGRADRPTGLPCPATQQAPTTKKSYTVKVHWPYVLTEAFFVVYQLGWAVLFATNGLVLCTIGAAYMASCVLYLGFFYGDHLGKVCFAFDRSRLRFPARRQQSIAPDAMPAKSASSCASNRTATTLSPYTTTAPAYPPGFASRKQAHSA
jgi:hypothetical protein